jgi:hypothetical protein
MGVFVRREDELLLTRLTGVRVTILTGHLLSGDRRVGGHTNRATICHFYVDTDGGGLSGFNFIRAHQPNSVFTEMADG